MALYASSSTPRRQVWYKALQKLQSKPGAVVANNPNPNNTIRQLKVKILKAINAES